MFHVYMQVDKVTNTMSISVGVRMSTVAKLRYMCVTSILFFFPQISIVSFTKVSIFYIMVQVYCCCFLTVDLRRVRFTMKAESVTKVSIFYIMVQVYCCCFLTVDLQRVHFTLKAESVTTVSIFYIMVQVYCCFLTVDLRRVHFTIKAESITKVFFT